MKKFAVVALVALAASSFAVNTASAFVPSKNFVFQFTISKGAQPAEPSSPGDEFHPERPSVSPRVACLAAGGTPKRKFDGSDFVLICQQ